MYKFFMNKIDSIYSTILNRSKQNTIDKTWLNFKVLSRWVGLTCFVATIIHSCPENYVNADLKNFAEEYLLMYKSIIFSTKESLLEILFNTKYLTQQLDLQQQNHENNLKELTEHTKLLLDITQQEHSKVLLEITQLNKIVLQNVTEIHNSKILLLEKKITDLSINSNSIIQSNQELLAALARTKEASFIGKLGASLGFLSSIIHLGVSIKRFLKPELPINQELTDMMVYLKEALDVRYPAVQDPNNPVFPRGSTPDISANIRRRV